jgi:hypothetical protein
MLKTRGEQFISVGAWRRVRVSALALLKMVMHARTGGRLEVRPSKKHLPLLSIMLFSCMHRSDVPALTCALHTNALEEEH